MNMWFPLFVNLENKKVLVIGGGKIAYKKITKILEYSANVTIVTEKIEEEKLLQLENVKIVDNKRIENDKDIIGELVKDYFLVIAATNDEKLNENIAKICDSRGILINNISSKTEMNAMFTAVVKNNEFQIGIGSYGKSCRRSKALKGKVQQLIDEISKTEKEVENV